MTQGDSPIRPPSRLVMEMDDGDYDGEDTFEIINSSDIETIMYDDLNDEGDDDSSDPEDDRKMYCTPSTDHASLVFSKHLAAVFCIGINPADDKFVITGGQDDKIFIWSSLTGDVCFESSVFSDSVIDIGFNHDGKYFAAVDMAGKVGVWKNSGPQYPMVWEEKLGDIQWMKWHRQSNILLVGEVAGSIYMWKIPSGECKVFGGYSSGLTDIGAFMPDGKRAVACYMDGTIVIHNLQNSTTVKYDATETNKDNFISVDVHPDNNLVALGSLSSKLSIIKTQGSKSINHFFCHEDGEKDSDSVSTSVECVAFSRNLPYNVVVAATDNGLHVIDYTKSDRWTFEEIFQKSRHEDNLNSYISFGNLLKNEQRDSEKESIGSNMSIEEQEMRGYIPIEDGVTKLVWPAGSHLVYVGTKVGNVAVCDVRALKRQMTLEGHTNSILALTLSPNGDTLFTASDDTTVRIFRLNEIFSKEDFVSS